MSAARHGAFRLVNASETADMGEFLLKVRPVVFFGDRGPNALEFINQKSARARVGEIRMAQEFFVQNFEAFYGLLQFFKFRSFVKLGLW
ncbi:hypothetical protein D3C87_1786910 [compost metagenome]